MILYNLIEAGHAPSWGQLVFAKRKQNCSHSPPKKTRSSYKKILRVINPRERDKHYTQVKDLLLVIAYLK